MLVSCIDVEIFLLGSCFFCVNSLTVPLKLLVPDFFNDLGKGSYKLSDGQVVLEVEDLDIILSLCDRWLINVNASPLLISSQNDSVSLCECSWVAKDSSEMSVWLLEALAQAIAVDMWELNWLLLEIVGLSCGEISFIFVLKLWASIVAELFSQLTIYLVLHVLLIDRIVWIDEHVLVLISSIEVLLEYDILTLDSERDLFRLDQELGVLM